MALYDSGLSCRQAARRLGQESGIIITPQTVARWARQIGKSRPVGDRRTVQLPSEAIRLYRSGLTLRQVAQRFGVSGTTVRVRLGETGIKLRLRTNKYALLADKVWLEGEYRTMGRGAMEIADRVGCSVLTVHYHLRRHGIPRKRKRRTRM